jgi:hypothetical protein
MCFTRLCETAEFLNNVKKEISIWGGGDFIMFLGIGQPNGPWHQKEFIKKFVLWDAWQLIKLINMNHNKYN